MGEISDALNRAKSQAAARTDDPPPRPTLAVPWRTAAAEDDRESGEPARPDVRSERPSADRFARHPQSDSGPSDDHRIGRVSREEGQSRAERIALLDPMDDASINFRQLAQQVKRRAQRRDMRAIVVTSPLPGDGKTTVACNLAVALTNLDRSRSICLVELDLRRPRMAACLGVDAHCGVEDVLAGRASVDEALLKADVPGLSVMVVRVASHAPEHLLTSSKLAELIGALKARFRMVVLDTPPIQAVADATSIIDVADACLLVVRAGRSPSASVREALDHLPSEKMLGCCLNFARRGVRAAGYGGYYEASATPSDGKPSPATAVEGDA